MLCSCHTGVVIISIDGFRVKVNMHVVLMTVKQTSVNAERQGD